MHLYTNAINRTGKKHNSRETTPPHKIIVINNKQVSSFQKNCEFSKKKKKKKVNLNVREQVHHYCYSNEDLIEMSITAC